ncbi:MAG: protein kinase [Gammaproteobacteria bacterium]
MLEFKASVNRSLQFLQGESKTKTALEDSLESCFQDIEHSLAEEGHAPEKIQEKLDKLKTDLVKLFEHTLKNLDTIEKIEPTDFKRFDKAQTKLAFTFAITRAENETFSLIINEKTKITGWRRAGTSQVLKKALALHGNTWERGVLKAKKIHKEKLSEFLKNPKEPNVIKNIKSYFIFPLSSVSLHKKEDAYKQSLYCPSATCSLSDLLPNLPKSCSLKDIFLICYDLIRGLRDMHSADIVHRDLLSRNILIKEDINHNFRAFLSDLEDAESVKNFHIASATAKKINDLNSLFKRLFEVITSYRKKYSSMTENEREIFDELMKFATTTDPKKSPINLLNTLKYFEKILTKMFKYKLIDIEETQPDLTLFPEKFPQDKQPIADIQRKETVTPEVSWATFFEAPKDGEPAKPAPEKNHFNLAQ